MKALRTLTILFALALMCLPAPSAAAEKPFKLDICAMPEHESFIFWYAKEQGWDKDEGLDFQIHFFQTGMDQLEALPAKQWVVGGTGTVPILVGALRYNTYLIGIANDESWVNAVTVRPDNPALKVKGWNPEYPNLLGSPETVKGKTFLTTTVSSAHYALSVWLRVLGLTEKDIVIKNMDQAQALSAFENGIGDGAVLWAPHAYVGEAKGWVLAGNPKLCKLASPCVLVADRKYADAHPDVTAKFLSIYLRAANMLQKETPESLAPEYCRFFQEFVGKSFTPEMAALDIKTHPVFNLEEQLALFDGSKGQSKAAKWMADIAEFFASVGRITPDELKVVKDGSYATDKFLKLVKQPIPDYK